jgi:hypothetical protein
MVKNCNGKKWRDIISQKNRKRWDIQNCVCVSDLSPLPPFFLPPSFRKCIKGILISRDYKQSLPFSLSLSLVCISFIGLAWQNLRASLCPLNSNTSLGFRLFYAYNLTNYGGRFHKSNWKLNSVFLDFVFQTHVFLNFFSIRFFGSFKYIWC